MKRCLTFPNKKRYPTEKDAETAIIIQHSEGSVELRSYYCESCKGWHLTSKN